MRLTIFITIAIEEGLRLKLVSFISINISGLSKKPFLPANAVKNSIRLVNSKSYQPISKREEEEKNMYDSRFWTLFLNMAGRKKSHFDHTWISLLSTPIYYQYTFIFSVHLTPLGSTVKKGHSLLCNGFFFLATGTLIWVLILGPWECIFCWKNVENKRVIKIILLC